MEEAGEDFGGFEVLDGDLVGGARVGGVVGVDGADGFGDFVEGGEGEEAFVSAVETGEAGLLDKDGRLPGIERVLIVDSLAAAAGGAASASSNTTAGPSRFKPPRPTSP